MLGIILNLLFLYLDIIDAFGYYHASSMIYDLYLYMLYQKYYLHDPLGFIRRVSKGISRLKTFIIGDYFLEIITIYLEPFID